MMRAYRSKLYCGLAAAAVWVGAAAQVGRGADEGPAADRQVAAFLAQHCARCHGEKKAEGDLRLDQLGGDLEDRATFDRWHAVARRLRSGEMPPEGEPKPEAAQAAAVLRRLTARLDEAAAAHRAAGRTVLRRLNRVEYENTVRDLFAVDVGVKDMLPEDSVALGFDNVGAALNVSPVLVERYLEAADAVLSAATAPVHNRPSKTERYLMYDSIPEWFQRSVMRRGDEVVLFRSDGSATQLNKFRAPVAGRYRFRVSASAYQSARPVAMAALAGNFYTAAGSARHIGYFDALPGQPRVIEFEAQLELRETIKVMPVALPRTYVRPENMAEYPGPGLAIQWIEAEGPLAEDWPSASYRRVWGDVDPRQGTLADARRLLEQLLPRAFRRPTTADDARPYVELVARSLEAGQPFEMALRGGIKAVLCSPRFLYLKEPPGPLDDYALASRLSYFLWSTMPDEELLSLASRGELTGSRDVLRAQVERMLNHPKARAFTENFTGQWLSLRDINFTTPDRQLYPEFDELLQWSMVRETHLFFEELLARNLSVLNFVDSDFALLNGRLAEHYGIGGVEGVEFRKVPLEPGHQRGGVLTQASVLKVTANGTTTSPVVRGVWVMDRILGQPAPPPPANVPAIEPDIRGAVTIREQLARHRQTPNCASCHAHIDPAGFALENYDVIGGWRDHYRAMGTRQRVAVPEGPLSRFLAKPQYGHGPAVEAGDVLPDGRAFANLREFKQLLLDKPEQVVRCVAEKLVIYATGSGLEYGDREELKRIVAETKPQGYGLRSLVQAVVQSELFRYK